MTVPNKNRLIFFTTDRGYLVPSLVAARQILAQPDVAAVADVIIFLVGFDDAEFAEISATLAPTGIVFLPLPVARYALPPGATFNPTHVPQSALARLAVGNDIPEHYDHVVYMDGDIQIVGDIAPLVLHDVAPGRLLAACDHGYLTVPEFGGYARYFQTYLDGLGIADPRDYFNSGVLAATRSTWIEISAAALDYMRHNSETCLYHDQSALNVVALHRTERMSPRYNFVSWYADMDAMRFLEPAIIHFTGGAKPWVSEARPWVGRFRQSYRQLLEEFAFLERFWQQKSPDVQRADDHRESVKRRKIAMILPLRQTARRRRARRYLRETAFAVA